LSTIKIGNVILTGIIIYRGKMGKTGNFLTISLLKDQDAKINALLIFSSFKRSKINDSDRIIILQIIQV
jgi:hypothetical protein